MRLKNDTENFAASFNITPPYQMRVIHSSKLIYPREIYQRGVQRKRVELIAADFNEYVANEPKISFRNGKYYVVDGQHTIEARILRNGGRALPILCKVYTGMTMQQEAPCSLPSRTAILPLCLRASSCEQRLRAMMLLPKNFSLLPTGWGWHSTMTVCS